MRSLYHQPGVGTVLVARDAAWAWHVYQAAPDATRLIRDCPAVWHVPVHADRAVSVDRELYFHCSGTQQWQRGDTGVLCSATELPVGTAAVADPAAVACPGVSLRRVANEALEAVETATGHGVVAVPPSRAQWLCATSTETEDCAVWHDSATGRLALRTHRRGAEDWDGLCWITPPAHWRPARSAEGEEDVLFATALPGRYLLAVFEGDRAEVQQPLPLSTEPWHPVGTAGRPTMPAVVPATDRHMRETPSRHEAVSHGSPWIRTVVSAGPVHPHATHIVRMAESWWRALSAEERRSVEKGAHQGHFGLPLATAALLLGTADTRRGGGLRRLAHRIEVVARYIDHRFALYRKTPTLPTEETPKAAVPKAEDNNAATVDERDETGRDSDPSGLDTKHRYELRALLSAYALLQDEPAECTARARQRFYAWICTGQYVYAHTAGDELGLPLLRNSQAADWHRNCALLYDAHGGAVVWRHGFTWLEHEMVVYDRAGHGLLVPPPPPEARLTPMVLPQGMRKPAVAPVYAIDHIVAPQQNERYAPDTPLRYRGRPDIVQRVLAATLPRGFVRPRVTPVEHKATDDLVAALRPRDGETRRWVPRCWLAPAALPWAGARGYLGDGDYATLGGLAQNGLDPAAVFHLATAVACYTTGVWLSLDALALFLFAVDPYVAQSQAAVATVLFAADSQMVPRTVTPVLWEAQAVERRFELSTATAQTRPDLAAVPDIAGLRCHGLFVLFLARATTRFGRKRSDTGPGSGPRSDVVRAVAVLRDLLRWLRELDVAATRLADGTPVALQRDALAHRTALMLAGGNPDRARQLVLALHALGLPSEVGDAQFRSRNPPSVDPRLRWLLRWLQTGTCGALALDRLPRLLNRALREDLREDSVTWAMSHDWWLPMPWDAENDEREVAYAPVAHRLHPYTGKVPPSEYGNDEHEWTRISDAARLLV